MNKVLNELHQDHVVLARALHGLLSQFGVIRQGGTVDVQRVSDLVDYVQNYPDLNHQPREDLIVAACLERSERGERLIERLRFEHRLLAEQSEDLRNLLEQCENDLPVSRKQLARCISRYVQTQLRHFSLEEDSFYSLASSELTSDDWQRIAEAMPPPRHGTSVGVTLHHRCERILRQLSDSSQPDSRVGSAGISGDFPHAGKEWILRNAQA